MAIAIILALQLAVTTTRFYFLFSLLLLVSTSLSHGDPSAFLPIVSFTLTSFSPPFAEHLMATGLELTGKSDLRFTDTLYKVTRT